MIVYKIITPEGYTRKGHWNEHNWFQKPLLETSGDGFLCGEGWIHAYEHPLLAMLHCDLHGYTDGLLIRGNAFGEIYKDNQMQLGTTKLLFMGETTKPEITIEQRRKYAMLCLLHSSAPFAVRQLATRYLDGDHFIDSAIRDYVYNISGTWYYDVLNYFLSNHYLGLAACNTNCVNLIELAEEAMS